VFLAIALCALLALLYEAPLRRGELLSYDDTAVLTPMKDIRSLAQYQHAREQNLILDVQPLRDLLSWLEFRAQEATGFYNPQLVNFALWIFILSALGGLLRQSAAVRAQTRRLMFGLFMIGAHPLAVNSVAWPSARKHLLAALFTLLATLCWQKAMRAADSLTSSAWRWALGALIASFASGLAQPIHLLWVFWAGLILLRLWWVDGKLRGWGLPTIWLSNLLGTLALLYANWQYYAGATYAARSGAAKLGSETWFLWWSDRFEALGRYLMQILLPIAPSIASYQRHHPLNWIGGALVVLTLGFLYVRWRRGQRLSIFSWRALGSMDSPAYWLSLAALPLILVHARSTEHLGWDTYLLFPWLMIGGLCILLSCGQSRHLGAQPGRAKSGFLMALALLALLWSGQTWWSARAWSDEGRLWSKAVARGEKTLALGGWSRWALQNNELDRGCEAALELFDLHPRHRDLDYLLGLCFYSLGEKYRDRNPLDLFQRVATPADMPRPWFEYYWAVTEMNRGQPEAAYARLHRLWHTRETAVGDAGVGSGAGGKLESGDVGQASGRVAGDFVWRFAFAELTSGLAANSLIICCRRQPAAVCGELKSFIRENVFAQHWDSALWEKTLAQASLDDVCRAAILERE
jgi:hypothetical protein